MSDDVVSAQPSTKRYIGDGVYAEFDGFAIVLTTEDGVSITNRIVLEPDVWSSLMTYAQALERFRDRVL